MRKKLISSLAIGFALTLWIGCSDSPPPPPKAKVIRMKIGALPPDLVEEGVAVSTESTGDGRELLAQASVDVSHQERQPLPVPREEPDASEPIRSLGDLSSSSPDETPDTPDQPPGDTSPSDRAASTGSADEFGASISEIVQNESSKDYIAYARNERVDPFIPLFKEEPETPKPPEPTVGDNGIPKPPPRRLTPLEKLDLSQLKLVGIVRTPKGNKAMVEEASGKGYIIDKGTYIGIHSGQVVEIKKDGIVVEEKDTDQQSGKVTVRTREIKFQRPSGDEYYEM